VQSPETGSITERRVVCRQLADVADNPSGHVPSRIGTRSPVSSAFSSAMS
jgi:hypothetical protein